MITTKLIKDGVESNPGPETSDRNYAIKKQYIVHTIKDLLNTESMLGGNAQRMHILQLYIRPLKILAFGNLLTLIIFWSKQIIFRDVCVATGVIQPLAVDQLPPNIYMESIYISTNSLSHESHLFLEKNNLLENYRHYSPSEKGNGAIFTCAGFSVAVLWTQDHFYVFDSHSRKGKGFHDPNGKAILLKFCSITSVNNYLKVFYSSIVSLDTQYDLQYVSIDIDRNSINEIKVKLQRKRKLQYNNSYNRKEEAKKRKIEQQKEYYDKNKDKIIDSKKQYNKNVRAIRRQQKFYYGDTVNKNYSSLKSSEAILDYVSEADPIAIIFEKDSDCFSDIDFSRERSKNYYEDNRENKKDQQRKYYKTNRDKVRKTQKEYNKKNSILISVKNSSYYSENKSIIKEKLNKKYTDYFKLTHSKERIELFSRVCKEGPIFVCIICERCLYKRSVKPFDQKKYVFEFENINYREKDLYICLNCNGHLKKQKVLPQAVWNKLEVFRILEVLSDLDRLEKVLISRRILFKKVTIMPKGKFPKMKGSICNVPIDTTETVNILPHGADSNGLIVVKLKRKFKSSCSCSSLSIQG